MPRKYWYYTIYRGLYTRIDVWKSRVIYAAYYTRTHIRIYTHAVNTLSHLNKKPNRLWCVCARCNSGWRATRRTDGRPARSRRTYTHTRARTHYYIIIRTWRLRAAAVAAGQVGAASFLWVFIISGFLSFCPSPRALHRYKYTSVHV